MVYKQNNLHTIPMQIISSHQIPYMGSIAIITLIKILFITMHFLKITMHYELKAHKKIPCIIIVLSTTPGVYISAAVHIHNTAIS